MQPAKMESLARTPEQTKLRSTRSCSLGIVVGSLWLRSRRAGGGAQKHWRSWSVSRGPGQERQRPHCDLHSSLGGGGGLACCLSRVLERSAGPRALHAVASAGGGTPDAVASLESLTRFDSV